MAHRSPSSVSIPGPRGGRLVLRSARSTSFHRSVARHARCRTFPRRSSCPGPPMDAGLLRRRRDPGTSRPAGSTSSRSRPERLARSPSPHRTPMTCRQRSRPTGASWRTRRATALWGRRRVSSESCRSMPKGAPWYPPGPCRPSELVRRSLRGRVTADRSCTPPAHSGASARMGRRLLSQCRSPAVVRHRASLQGGPGSYSSIRPAVATSTDSARTVRPVRSSGRAHSICNRSTRPMVVGSHCPRPEPVPRSGKSGSPTADGSNFTRLTRGPRQFQGYPGWSPDGSTVVFESKDDKGTADVWTIKASGSGLHQVTRHVAEEILPSFSRNGRFIYFSSNRTGRYEVWRVATSGGPEEQITRNGGVFPLKAGMAGPSITFRH